jgi:hypothetical protein
MNREAATPASRENLSSRVLAGVLGGLIPAALAAELTDLLLGAPMPRDPAVRASMLAPAVAFIAVWTPLIGYGLRSARAAAVWRRILLCTGGCTFAVPVAWFIIGLRQTHIGMGGIVVLLQMAFGIARALILLAVGFWIDRPRRPHRPAPEPAAPPRLHIPPLPPALTKTDSETELDPEKRYALLQCDLDQTIRREAMEQASRAAPQVAVGDCARLHRDLFGIVVRQLDMANALAFQSALRAQGLDTDIVHDTDLMRLPPAQSTRHLRIDQGSIVTEDAYGHARAHALSTLAFAAAGRIVSRTPRRMQTEELEYVHTPGAKLGRMRPVTTTVTRWEDEESFRIDLFFTHEPVRIEWSARKGRAQWLSGASVQPADTNELHAFLSALHAWATPGRDTRGIAHAGTLRAPTYPSLAAFEEEILWSFYRMRST